MSEAPTRGGGGGEAANKLRRLGKASNRSVVEEMAAVEEAASTEQATPPPIQAPDAPVRPEPATMRSPVVPAPAAATPAAEHALPPLAASPALGAAAVETRTEPTKGKDWRTAVRHPTREEYDRIRAAYQATSYMEGSPSLNDFLRNALLDYCETLEAKYNHGEPFKVAGAVRRGRPPGS